MIPESSKLKPVPDMIAVQLAAELLANSDELPSKCNGLVICFKRTQGAFDLLAFGILHTKWLI